MAGESTPKTPMGGVKAFSCRGCGGQINLLAPGQSLAAACRHCGAVADLTDDNFRILNEARVKAYIQPLLEIGSRGQFEGKSWMVIGMMVREVTEYEFEWEEYLLFNPYHGFRFLANSYGHWSWIKMVQDLPISQYESNSIGYHANSFRKLTQGVAEVKYVLGEFYWQAKVGDLANTSDFVAPPLMLSRELESGGMIWSLCEYVEPQALADAFGIDRKSLPSKRNVGANQPNPYKRNLSLVLAMWILGMIATFLIGSFSGAPADQLPAFSQKYIYPIVEDTVSPEFTLSGGINNVDIDVRVNSGLDNHWVEYSGVLHNIESNLNYEFVLPVEYYFGVTDGESWSEGAIMADVCLNEIPDGKYELISSVASDSQGEFTVSVQRGVKIYSNYWIVIGLLTIMPMILFFLSSQFEKKRNA